VRFLVDAQLPPALARQLSEHGHTAEHVADVGLLSAPDSAIWGYAITHDAVVITKDEDFPDLVVLGQPAPIVVWIRVGNTTRRGLLDWFEPLVDRVVEMVDAGERLIELR
jgi:predicted nuclease of predicted toxin-antitoxin system